MWLFFNCYWCVFRFKNRGSYRTGRATFFKVHFLRFSPSGPARRNQRPAHTDPLAFLQAKKRDENREKCLPLTPLKGGKRKETFFFWPSDGRTRTGHRSQDSFLTGPKKSDRWKNGSETRNWLLVWCSFWVFYRRNSRLVRPFIPVGVNRRTDAKKKLLVNKGPKRAALRGSPLLKRFSSNRRGWRLPTPFGLFPEEGASKSWCQELCTLDTARASPAGADLVGTVRFLTDR